MGRGDLGVTLNGMWVTGGGGGCVSWGHQLLFG